VSEKSLHLREGMDVWSWHIISGTVIRLDANENDSKIYLHKQNTVRT
jgi:hypothetical protein